ncbi:sugar ABC transporter ATP-binding protein [Streptomyces sp. NPDC000880]
MTKSFGPTKALTDGTLSIAPGEIVALMGENGSGKSTLVKTLSGVLRPDSGEIRLDGSPLSLSTPRAALRAGVVTVFQEILVAPYLSVVDNLWLGSGSPLATRRNETARRAEAERVLSVLSPEPPPLDATVGELDLMQQQVCVIARGLLRRPRLLILDEVTSTLDVTIRDRFFAELRRLCAAGAGALFISHRMDEVLSLADRFVALRSGATVGTLDRAEATAERLVRLISGEEAAKERIRSLRASAADARPVLEADGVKVRADAPPVHLTARRGEIIGLAGLEGHGQDEFLRILAGLRPLEAGAVRVVPPGGQEAVTVRSYRQAVGLGMAYVPRDRKSEGIADVLSSLDNFSVPTLRRDSLAGVIRYRMTRARFRKFGRTVNLAPAPRTAVGRLSGGNQQKVIIARWLATEPGVLLLNDPTRGVDLKTKHELYDLFERLAEEGMTIVMLSTEVEEHLNLMDRILVFHSGSCTSELTHKEADRESLVSAYFGQRRDTLAHGGRR